MSRSPFPRLFASAAVRRRTLALVGILAGAGVATAALVATHAPHLADPTWLRARIAAYGPWAPLVFVLLQAVQVLAAPVPGQALAAVGGYLFGGPAGAAYSLLGVVLGSAVAFGLARRYGRPYVERAVDPAALERFDGFVERHGRVGLFVAFLFPAFPDDLLCLLAGLSELRARPVLALLVVGRAPSFVVAAVVGGRTAAMDYRLALGLLVATMALTAAVPRFGGRLLDAVGQRNER